MTSIFFPFSAGWMLLSRVYCLPSTKSAELALEKASTASVPTTSMASLFIATPARGRYLTLLGPLPPTGVPAGGRTRALGALGVLDHRNVEPALAKISFDAIELVGIVVGAEADSVAHRLIGKRGHLHRRFPAREREPRLEVFCVGFAGEGPCLEPQAIDGLGLSLRRLWSSGLLCAGQYLVEVEPRFLRC